MNNDCYKHVINNYSYDSVLLASLTVRQFGELPFHLVRARRFVGLYENVLFNYEWLHAKMSSCPLQAVLSDFEDACNNVHDREASR